MARSCASAVCTTWPSAPSAEPAATGSVASAATSIAGLSPRRTARSKLAGISTANSTLPEASSSVELGFVARQLGDLEIVGVLQRRQDRAAEIAVLLQQHRGRQMARLGVDGVAEQHQLHQRDHDDHGERHPVAPELDELLDQHRPGLAPEAVAGKAARRLLGMHMASLEIVLRLAHQVDEHVLERGLGPLPLEILALRDRARSPLRALPRRGPTRAGWCRTAPPCRRPACR